MDFKAQLLESIKQAMKARDSLRLGTLRFLLAQIKNAEIDEGTLSDEQIQKLIAKQVKQLKEALVEYEKAGREDIAIEERQKIAILEEYLPQQLSDAELEALVDETLASTQERNMGKIMAMVMPKVQGRADGNRISAVVKAKLA